MTYVRPLAAVLAAALIGGVPLAGFAQGNPSSDQIINSLRPGVGLGGGTRGLRPGGPAAPAAAAEPAAPAPSSSVPSSPGSRATRPVRPAAPPAATADANPSVNLTVEFRTGSADLSATAIHTLDELGKALSSSTLSTYRFRIEGHTDTVGSKDANKGLSERRAAAVVDYLVSHFNVDRSKLEAVGMGEEGLLVATGDQVAEPRNRRVLVVNLGA